MFAMLLAISLACLANLGTSYMVPVALMRRKNANIKITADAVSSTPIVPMIEVETVVEVSHEQMAAVDSCPARIISWSPSTTMCAMDEVEVGKMIEVEAVVKVLDDQVAAVDSCPARIISWRPSTTMCAMDEVEVLEVSSTLVSVTDDNDFNCEDKSVMALPCLQAVIVLLVIEVVALVLYYRKEFASIDEYIEEFSFAGPPDSPPCLGKVGEVSVTIDLRVDIMAKCREFIVNQ